jgi:hypothetical protein
MNKQKIYAHITSLTIIDKLKCDSIIYSEYYEKIIKYIIENHNEIIDEYKMPSSIINDFDKIFSYIIFFHNKLLVRNNYFGDKILTKNTGSNNC